MEIERKFLISKFPDFECIETVDINQGYLSVEPEVRVLSYKCDEYIDYRLTVKSDGDLSREEIEIYVTEKDFAGYTKVIGKPLIKKLYKKYLLKDGLILECNRVDAGFKMEFMYVEIEFDDEDEALRFICPDFLGKEVTYDPTYKMKNYWKRTRCDCKLI